MINHCVNKEQINLFIIECIKIIIKKKKTLNKKIKIIFKDHKIGPVIFSKNKGDDFFKIHLLKCKYGYDFFNQDNINTSHTEECCVCFEQTHSVIKCGHRVCDECVQNIMKHIKKVQCPLCRENHENNNGLIINYPLHLATLLFSQV